MARMFPERLPQYILDDPKLAAERRVYNHLASLSDEYLVFYRCKWQQRKATGRQPQDGEADFVIAHPKRGLLVIEVKGGRISYDPLTDRWTSTDRSNEVHEIKDPVVEAKSSHYALLDALKSMPRWPNNLWTTIGHVVCLTDVSVSNSMLRLDMPRQIVLDAEDLLHVSQAIDRAFDHYGEADDQTGLNKAQLDMVQALLANSFTLKASLGLEISRLDERLIELTEDQHRMLDFIGNHPKAVIEGCAGSGKTMLAVEKAKRLARQGFSVVLVCFNFKLAEYLKQLLASSRVDVFHFHGFCRTIARKAQMNLPDERESMPDSYFNQTLPDALFDATDKLGPQYDAIIVDEGQDFSDTWWLPLRMQLRDSSPGIFYVFRDNNQNIYRRTDGSRGITGDEPPHQLVENCRNSNAIHRFVAAFHDRPAMLRCRAPEGIPVQAVFYQGDEHLLRQLSKLLHKVLIDGQVRPEDVAILTPRAQGRSILTPGMAVGSFRISYTSPETSNSIFTSTVHGFKGLERRVVIMVEIDQYIGPHLEQILYVGCSRARTHLTLLADQAVKGMIAARLPV